MNALQLTRRVSLDWKEYGRHSDVPVLMLHGYTDSRRSFDRVLARLPEPIHAIAVSMRGHGDSERPKDGYSVDQFVADLADFLDLLRIRQAVIAGHSMGSLIAQRFAIDYPERTRGLVLIGAFHNMSAHPGVLDLWESTVARLEDPIDPSIVQDFQQSTLSRPIPPAFFDIVVRESLKVPAHVWKATLRSLLETDFTRDLPRIKAPTMLVWGDQDFYASRSEQERLIDAIPGARLNVYAGIGHSPQWEDPTRFTDDIVDFMERNAA